MELELQLLHQSMQEQTMRATKFRFTFRTLEFSLIYAIEEEFPHELLFGCLANNLFFTINVQRNYQIIPRLDSDKYRQLVQALNLTYDPNNHFSPRTFFEEFNQHIPNTTCINNVPTVNEIAQNRRDIDEDDKRYFTGWKAHNGEKSNAKAKNLEKTKKTCGQDIYEFCMRNNISSRWTDKPELAKDFYNPN